MRPSQHGSMRAAEAEIGDVTGPKVRAAAVERVYEGPQGNGGRGLCCGDPRGCMAVQQGVVVRWSGSVAFVVAVKTSSLWKTKSAQRGCGRVCETACGQQKGRHPCKSCGLRSGQGMHAVLQACACLLRLVHTWCAPVWRMTKR